MGRRKKRGWSENKKLRKKKRKSVQKEKERLERKERRLSLFLANFGKRLPVLYFFFSQPIRQHQRLHWPVKLSSPSSWPNLLSSSIFQKAKLGSLTKIAAVAEERRRFRNKWNWDSKHVDLPPQWIHMATFPNMSPLPVSIPSASNKPQMHFIDYLKQF